MGSLHDCHCVGEQSSLLPSDLNSSPTNVVQLCSHFVLHLRKAGDDPHRPAHHHRLGFGANDEEFPEDGGQALLSEGLLASVDLDQVGVLQIPSAVAAVILPVLSDPLLTDLVEPISVVPEDFQL